jgi:hypothetical protein
MTPRQIIAFVTSAAVLVGLGNQPYGYYMLLRFVMCGFSLFLLFGDTPIAVVWQRWLTGACAVLYNPLVPIRIGQKGIWIVLNVLTVAWFWFLAIRQATIARQNKGN